MTSKPYTHTPLYDIYNGDCLEIMPQLIEEDVKVDLILTDPPYGTTACKWDSVIPFDKMWDLIHSCSRENTAVCLFGTEPFSSFLRMSNIKEFRYDWIWHKNMSGSFATARKMPMKYHEVISVFYRKLPLYNPQFQEYSDSVKKRYKQGEIMKQAKGVANNIQGICFVDSEADFERGKYPESVQYFKAVRTSQGNRKHPTQKPVPLLEYLIKTYTNSGDTVLDFTMGSGSTGVACMQTDRNFIGIELDKEYYGIAEKRIKETRKQTKLI